MTHTRLSLAAAVLLAATITTQAASSITITTVSLVPLSSTRLSGAAAGDQRNGVPDRDRE